MGRATRAAATRDSRRRSTAGFRPEPYRRGLWLFPHAGDGTFAWRGYEDDGDTFGPPDLWRADGRSTPRRVEVAVRRDGPGTWGDARLTLLLPPGDTRDLVVTGGTAVPAVGADGRRGVTLTLA